MSAENTENTENTGGGPWSALPTMKAAVLHEYGPPEVLHVEEVAKLLPGDGDVLIKVHATSVNFGDTLVRNFKAVSPRAFHMPSAFWLIGRASFGLAKPRRTILGSEFSGDVAEVGKAVTARLALIHLVIHRTAKRRTGFRPRV